MLLAPLVQMLLLGVIRAALLNQSLLCCALLWLLLDIIYVLKLSILMGLSAFLAMFIHLDKQSSVG